MREILGNDVAVKAIAEKHINPWPDGTVFAKVAWQQAAPDDKGVVKAGRVHPGGADGEGQPEICRDRWVGLGSMARPDLKPYGKDAGFQNECTSCHEPVAKNDYVYTMPIGGQK